MNCQRAGRLSLPACGNPTDTTDTTVREPNGESASMSSISLNTTPLFQTSLRDWQANWKARQGSSGHRPGGGHPDRLGRLCRRPKRHAAGRPRA
jgi:hypothetical protein